MNTRKLIAITLVALFCISIPSVVFSQAELKDVGACGKSFKVGLDKFLAKEINIQEAQDLARKINQNLPGWYNYLPCCPATKREVQSSPDWKEDNTCLEYFHSGAKSCYRSAEAFRSSQFEKREVAREHGQQCCYDAQGNLLISGSGAGTPDLFLPDLFSLQNLFNSDNHLTVEMIGNHFLVDVITWFRLPLSEYHETWVPNRGCNYPFRQIVDANAWTDVILPVKKGDVLNFSDAKGTIVWGMEGSTSGPEGSPKIAESLLGLALAPPILPEARTGSLIGMIYKDVNLAGASLKSEFKTKPFFIGKGTSVKVLTDGKLLLGVNDSFRDNNSGYFDVQIHRRRDDATSR